MAPISGFACASAVRRRLHRRFALFPIVPLLPPLPRLKIVDVGAMSLGEGTLPYADLVKATPCDVIGFEPVQVEVDKLSRDKNKRWALPALFHRRRLGAELLALRGGEKMLDDLLVVQAEAEFVELYRHENYHSFDFAALALEEYDRQKGTQLQKVYLGRLTSPGG
jgi:hypothetical protein